MLEYTIVVEATFHIVLLPDERGGPVRVIVAITTWLQRVLSGTRVAFKSSWQLASSRLGVPWRIESPYRALLLILVLFFALGGGLIAGMHNIKTEIVEGPNRVLDQVASPDDGWLLQKGTTNLVDDSFVPRDVVAQLRADGYNAVPFTRSYRAVYIDGDEHAALVFDTPTPLDEGDSGVVLDKTFGASIGGTISIGGQDFTVTGLTSGTSALGKEGVFLSPEQYLRLGGATDLVSGAFIDGGVPAEYSEDYGVYTAPEFKQYNYDYWLTQGGSLPLLVAQMVNVFTFAIIVCLLALVFTLVRKVLVALRAVGATVPQIMSAELFYLICVWAVSLPFQWSVYWLVVGASKAETAGYLGALTHEEFLQGWAGMLLVILVSCIGMSVYARRALADKKLAEQLARE